MASVSRDMRILVIERDREVALKILAYFEARGHQLDTIGDGIAGLHFAASNGYDAVILDWMLPRMEGPEVLRRLRLNHGVSVPVVMLAAKVALSDKIIAFRSGADDYVTKPFSNRELLARVKAHLRRTETIETAVAEENAISGTQELTIGNLQILPDAFVAKKYGNEVELTHREFELLHHLANHIGQVMTREHLLETVWGYDYFGDVRTVDVTVRRLREKIEDTPSRPEYILTRRGVGYYMKAHD